MESQPRCVPSLFLTLILILTQRNVAHREVCTPAHRIREINRLTLVSHHYIAHLVTFVHVMRMDSRIVGTCNIQAYMSNELEDPGQALSWPELGASALSIITRTFNLKPHTAIISVPNVI